ncbi:UNVERIFIED_CONTAM: MADS-box protein [Sesamum latifolium]|uniref:MADS-box protein n=1 Tax=Sesamum latifolium TaxID=2727402 RepID=A0AAW2UZ76_9LAMI
MMQLIQRHSMQSEKSNKPGQQPLHIQSGSSNHAKISKELGDLTLELKQLMGEELQGLGMSDLMKLEKLVETGLSRVGKTKESELMEENARLKQEANQAEIGKCKKWDGARNSAESITNSHQDLAHRPDEDSDTSLKLGLPFSNGN